MVRHGKQRERSSRIRAAPSPGDWSTSDVLTGSDPHWNRTETGRVTKSQLTCSHSLDWSTKQSKEVMTSFFPTAKLHMTELEAPGKWFSIFISSAHIPTKSWWERKTSGTGISSSEYLQISHFHNICFFSPLLLSSLLLSLKLALLFPASHSVISYWLAVLPSASRCVCVSYTSSWSLGNLWGWWFTEINSRTVLSVQRHEKFHHWLLVTQ